MAPEQLPRVGDFVLVQRDFITKPGCGYIIARQGERLQVWYIGLEGSEEDGWLYVRRASTSEAAAMAMWPAPVAEEDSLHQGWLPASLVVNACLVDSTSSANTASAACSSTATARCQAVSQLVFRQRFGIIGGIAIARRSVVAASGGYLAVNEGETLRVLYHGSLASGDEGWLFTCRDEMPSEKGWLHREAVLEIEDANGVAAIIAESVEARAREPMACTRFATTVHTPTLLRPHPDMNILDFPNPRLEQGASVDVVEVCGSEWAKVEVQGGVKGWILVTTLAECPAAPAVPGPTQEPESEPPPPPKAPPFSEPPLTPEEEARYSWLCKGDVKPAPTSMPTPVPAPDAITAASAAWSWLPPQHFAHSICHVGAGVATNALSPAPQPGSFSAAFGPDLSGFLSSQASTLMASSMPLPPPMCPLPVWHDEGSAVNLRSGATSMDAVQAVPSAHRRGSGPGQCHCRVMLFSFGLETFEEELAEKCYRHLGGGASIKFSDSDIQAALSRKSFDARAIVVDARSFPDPEAMYLRGHTGHHHAIISRICDHKNFRRWLAGVKRKFLDAVCAEPQASGLSTTSHALPLTMAFYCRVGKHRSVACSQILEHILRAEGWDCPVPRHLSSPRWGKKCCHGQCHECREPPDHLQTALNTALYLWHGIKA